MTALLESIQKNGILTPLIVRPIEDTDEYEVISGHRRLHAAQKAGITEVPALIYALDRDAAAIAVVDSNLHREHILPSEKAFAYKLKMEALSHQGKRTDLTSDQVGPKLTAATISETDSASQVKRYIRLTYLIPEFLEKMDKNEIALSVGVELSFLDEQSQREVLEQCAINDCTPSYSQAWRMHKADREGTLSKVIIQAIMSEENVWTHIISLHREDAERLGYNHAEAWRTLLRTHRNDIAAAMKIPPEDFRWYAAFHDEGNHPHIHMMAWSVKPNQAYLSKDGIRQIKSTLTNQIFRQELLHVYEQKSKSRDELVAEARKAMLELAKAMQEMTCDHPEAEQMIWELSRQLGQVSGKKTYGYLPKPMKKLVDEIVDQMVRLPVVNECYQMWWELQCQVEDYYAEEKKRIRPPLSQQKEFRQIKNAVIKEAEHIRVNKISFEDTDMQDDGERISTYDMSYECHELQSVANDDSYPLEERDEAAEQLEQLAEAGDAHAQHIIGTAYRDGGLLIPDTVKARKLLERAAEQEIDAAQYALGKLYLSDDAYVHDPAKGIYWLKRSADNGNDYAAYRLGKEYLSGKNVPKDASAAAEYLWQAANSGNAYAQYLLGKLYLTGKGVQQDTDAAYQWFTKAYYGGHTYAGMFMDRIDRGEQRPPSVMLAATRLLYHMGNIFWDNAPAMPTVGGIHIDRKRLQELQRKRIALGHKPDDHELEPQGYTMQFR